VRMVMARHLASTHLTVFTLPEGMHPAANPVPSTKMKRLSKNWVKGGLCLLHARKKFMEFKPKIGNESYGLVLHHSCRIDAVT